MKTDWYFYKYSFFHCDWGFSSDLCCTPKPGASVINQWNKNNFFLFYIVVHNLLWNQSLSGLFHLFCWKYLGICGFLSHLHRWYRSEESSPYSVYSHMLTQYTCTNITCTQTFSQFTLKLRNTWRDIIF